MEIILLVVVAVVLYLMPCIVASYRGHHQGNAICVLNLLLGWTALGWIVALIWSATAVKPELVKPSRNKVVSNPCPKCGALCAWWHFKCPECGL